MLGVRLDQLDALWEPEPPVGALALTEDIPRALDVEEILRRRHDEHRPWRAHEHIIGLVQAGGELPEVILLEVLRADGFQQPPEAREITGRRGSDDALIQRHQVTGHGAATRDAGAAEAVTADVLPTLQVVEGAHAVPNHRSRETVPHGGPADAHQLMFTRGTAELRLAIRLTELSPLTLAYRVVAKDRQARMHEADGGLLIDSSRLRDVRVPAGHQHRRVRPGPWRQIKQAGDDEARLTLKQDLLQPIRVEVALPRHPRVQRRALW